MFRSSNGVADVIVHGISIPVTASAFGTLPKKVVTYGIQVPQVGSLVRVHSIEVPLRAPGKPLPSSVEIGVHGDLAKVIDCNYDTFSGRLVPVMVTLLVVELKVKPVTSPTAGMCMNPQSIL